ANANGGAATGGTIDASGGTANGGAAAVNNTSNLTQSSTQAITTSSNWQKWSWDYSDHSVNDSFNTTDSFNRKYVHRGWL
ncbi:MAG TPA: hypothetical protein VGF10_14385, partial [Gaiella sp.]